MERYYEYKVIIKEREKDIDRKNIYAVTACKEELTEQLLKEDLIELYDDVIFLSIKFKEISLKKFSEIKNKMN